MSFGAFSSSPSSLHPVSIPQAVACGGGWGCCPGGGPQALSVFIIIFVIVFVIVVCRCHCVSSSSLCVAIPPLPPLSTLVPLVFSSALIHPCHLASPSSPLIRHFNPLIVSPPCPPSSVVSTPSSSPTHPPTLPYHCWPHSTRDPPHEQWLVRLVAGGLLYDAVMFVAGPVGVVGVI